MSPLLQEFYDEMYLAINGKQPVWFLHSAGLCLNLIYFLDERKITGEEKTNLKFEMRKQFHDVGLSENTPFNHSNLEFQYEQFKYENKYRIEWVNDHVSSS
jgi:hypothetical protein